MILHRKASAEVLDDVVGNRQAKPEALAHALGGEERIENARGNRIRHARTVIAYGDGDDVAVAPGAKLDGAVRQALDRIGSVGDDIDQDLLEANAAGVDHRRCVAEIDGECCISGLEPPGNDFQRVGDNLGKGDGLKPLIGLSREIAQVTADGGHPVGQRRDAGDIVTGLSDALTVDQDSGIVGIGLDGRQRLVELM
jgi:hypothetical protein